MDRSGTFLQVGDLNKVGFGREGKERGGFGYMERVVWGQHVEM